MTVCKPNNRMSEQILIYQFDFFNNIQPDIQVTLFIPIFISMPFISPGKPLNELNLRKTNLIGKLVYWGNRLLEIYRCDDKTQSDNFHVFVRCYKSRCHYGMPKISELKTISYGYDEDNDDHDKDKDGHELDFLSHTQVMNGGDKDADNVDEEEISKKVEHRYGPLPRLIAIRLHEIDEAIQKLEMDKSKLLATTR